MRRARAGFTRREFLAATAKGAAASAALSRLPVALRPQRAAASGRRVLTRRERGTLDAALSRMVPAEGPDDWSAADVGAGDYIERLLAGEVYAGGPTRRQFRRFQRLPRAKAIGWGREIRRLRKVYRRGLAELDRRAGGEFASLPPEARDRILESMDLEGTAFFGALYEHAMEGVYAHPVYGGNHGYRAWRELGYEGDVHGVRFPGIGSPEAPWNVHGGYAPKEIEARPEER